MALTGGVGEHVAFTSLIGIFLGKSRIQTLISSHLSKHEAPETCRRRNPAFGGKTLESRPSTRRLAQLTVGQDGRGGVSVVVHYWVKVVYYSHL